MIVRGKEKVYRHKIEQNLDKNASAKDALDYIFGDSIYSDGNADFVISTWESSKKKAHHKLNMFWAVPLFCVLCPFQYVFTGSTGFDTKTKFGRFVLRSCGEMRDETTKMG